MSNQSSSTVGPSNEFQYLANRVESLLDELVQFSQKQMELEAFSLQNKKKLQISNAFNLIINQHEKEVETCFEREDSLKVEADSSRESQLNTKENESFISLGKSPKEAENKLKFIIAAKEISLLTDNINTTPRKRSSSKGLTLSTGRNKVCQKKSHPKQKIVLARRENRTHDENTNPIR